MRIKEKVDSIIHVYNSMQTNWARVEEPITELFELGFVY